MFRWEPDAAKRTEAVRTGAADLAEVPPGGALDALAGDRSVRLLVNRVPRLAVLGLRVGGDSPFADAARRAVIAHRVDRAALSMIVDGGRSLPGDPAGAAGHLRHAVRAGRSRGHLPAQLLPIVGAALYSGARTARSPMASRRSRS